MIKRTSQQVYADAFSQALNEQLTRQSMTQAGLARATGVTSPYINKLMSGGKNISPEWADLISDTLRLDAQARRKLHVAAAQRAGYKIEPKD